MRRFRMKHGPEGEMMGREDMRRCHRHIGGPCRRDLESVLDPNDLDGLFMACARRMRHERHRRFGSTQDRIVRILNENGGTMGQKALQLLLGVQPGSISEILSKMEEKGLIIRDKDDDDRRASLIRLNTEVKDEEKAVSLFDVLSDEEKESLKAILNKVLTENRKEEE